MLKIKVNHFYGSQEKHDLQLVKLSLEKEGFAEIEALENGWLISNNEWYACRSVRLSVDQYKPVVELPNTLSYEFTTYDPETVTKIYTEYKAYKKFEEDYNIFTDPNRSLWLIVKDEGVPVAFTKFIRYQEGLESQFTCWNYHKPKMQLGKGIVNKEISYAKSFGLNHLYIGQGYEKGSLFKANYPGFEWWNGTEWSSDVNKYKELCARDSSINTLQELAKVYNNG